MNTRHPKNQASDQAQLVVEYIDNQVRKSLSQKLPLGTIFRHTKTRHGHRLDFFNRPNRKSLATLTCENHHYRLTGFPSTTYNEPIRNLHIAINDLVREVQSKHRHNILSAARHKFSPTKLDMALTDPAVKAHHTVAKLARQLAHASFTRFQTQDGQTRPASLTNYYRHVDQLVRQDIPDAQVMELANQIYQSSWAPTFHQYNTTLLNFKAFQQINEHSPAVIQLFLMWLTTPPKIEADDEIPEPLDHGSAADIIRALRYHTGFTDAQWSYLSSLSTAPRNDRDNTINLELTRAALELMVRTNSPHSQHHNFITHPAIIAQWQHAQNTRWNCGDADQEFTNILTAHINTKESHPDNNLHNILDAFSFHISHQLPWTKSNLEGYTARSTRFHRTITEHKTLMKAANIGREDWDSALAETQLGDFRINPVVNPEVLTSIGRTMHNCLDTYTYRCQSGQVRVFTITPKDDDILMGVFAITADHTMRWYPLQLELYGEHDQSIVDTIKSLPLQAAQLYTQQQPLPDIAA